MNAKDEQLLKYTVKQIELWGKAADLSGWAAKFWLSATVFNVIAVFMILMDQTQTWLISLSCGLFLMLCGHLLGQRAHKYANQAMEMKLEDQ